MKINIFGTKRVLQDGQNSRHGPAEVVVVESHGDVYTGVCTGVAVAEGGGFPENGESFWAFSGEAEADVGGGSSGC